MTNSSGRRGWAILLALLVLALGLAPASRAELKDPQKLVSFLKIELPGWQVKEGYPKLERITEKGQTYVEAQVIYTSGKSTLTAVIMEGATISEEVDKVRKFPKADNEKEYCRTNTVQGFEAVEIYENGNKTGFLFILVADHCLIPIQGKEVESTKVLKDLVNKINLPQLAALLK